ncbi:MAG: gliding motility-associated C-terminal domain-containing protein [Flavobacteriales bacterium]|nr:gliding motility-associated C-terminal domain-containing protein [Flavobacteriales bacterium]
MRCLFPILLVVLSVSGHAQNLLNGLIVHYPMTGNALDIGPSGFHGIVNGAVLGTDEDGNPNGAYYFDGVNDFIDFPNDPFLKPQFTFTIACTVKFDNPLVIEDTPIFTLDFLQDNYHGAWSNLVNGQIGISFGGGLGGNSSPNRRTKLGTTILNAGQWYNITLIVRGQSNMEIYIDCVNDGGSYSGTGSSQIVYSNVPGCLGRGDGNTNGAANYFKGAISDFRMWDRELTELEITYLCNPPCGIETSADTAICVGSNVTLTATTAGFIGWSDAYDPGNILSTDTAFNVAPTSTTSYLAQSDCGTATIVVEVDSSGDMNLGPDTLTCSNETIVLGDLNSVQSLLWSDGSTDNIYEVNSSGTYWAEFANACGTYRDTVSVGFLGYDLNADFLTRSKPVEFLDPNVQFVNESNGATNYEWHFGDGEVSYEENPEHNYDTSGVYLVMLVAYGTDGLGCADTTYGYVSIDPMFTFYVPNSFTPDGDGINDTWGGIGLNFEYESFELEIFDRWGGLIWQTDDPFRGWDGTHMKSGKRVKQGMYVYQFRLRQFNTFEPKVLKGTVTLYRHN